MRKILFIICWALAGVGLYSCSLDEPSYGKTTSDNYYQKESDIEQALTGAYLQLRTTWNEYALNHYFVGDCSTDAVSYTHLYGWQNRPTACIGETTNVWQPLVTECGIAHV